MTVTEALGKWTRCAQVCHRKGSFFLEENDGELARKLQPYGKAEVINVTPTGIWPSGRYAGVVKVLIVAATIAKPASDKPGAVIVPAEAEKSFYLAVR